MSLLALAFAGFTCAALSREPLAPTSSSDPTAVYALLDKAELDEGARTLVLHGAFLIGVGLYGDRHRSAAWGAMHLRAAGEHAEVHLRAFRDIARVAGKDEVVSFGTRRDGVTYAVGRADAPRWIELKSAIQAYSLGEMQHSGLPVQLRSFARSIELVFQGDPTYAGARLVDIVVHPGTERHPSLLYVLQLEHEDGQAFASAALPIGGDGMVRWKDYFYFASEERVRLRVHALHERIVSASVLSREVRAPKTAAGDGDVRR
jgi:hypothetical protein